MAEAGGWLARATAWAAEAEARGPADPFWQAVGDDVTRLRQEATAPVRTGGK